MVSAPYLQFDVKCVMCLPLSLKKDRRFIMGHHTGAVVRTNVFTRVTLQLNYSSFVMNEKQFL